jgi:hypothetical protein
MKAILAVIPILGLTLGFASFAVAQSTSPSGGGLDPRTGAEAPTSHDKGTVLPTTPSAPTETLRPTVEQEIEALKNRINQLEDEVRKAHTERPEVAETQRH